jgi:hypothetical protein
VWSSTGSSLGTVRLPTSPTSFLSIRVVDNCRIGSDENGEKVLDAFKLSIEEGPVCAAIALHCRACTCARRGPTYLPNCAPLNGDTGPTKALYTAREPGDSIEVAPKSPIPHFPFESVFRRRVQDFSEHS